MNVEELFHRLLGLGKSWEVIGCEYQEEANSFFVVIEETARLWEQERCPKCGQAVRCYDHVEAISLRHLHVFNKQSEILCELPRGRCRECGQRPLGSSHRISLCLLKTFKCRQPFGHELRAEWLIVST